MQQTQCDRVLAFICKHGAIDPLQAWTELGVYRLGARIHDLKRRGVAISVERTYVVNRFGEKCGPVALYRLGGGA